MRKMKRKLNRKIKKNTEKTLERKLSKNLFFSSTKSTSKFPLVRLDRNTYQKIIWIQGLLQQKFFRRFTIGQAIKQIVEQYIDDRIKNNEVTQEDVEMLNKITKEG